jgi:hypothetical protein
MCKSLNIRPRVQQSRSFYLMINTTGVTSGTGTANPSGTPEFTLVYFGVFWWGLCWPIFGFLSSVL